MQKLDTGDVKDVKTFYGIQFGSVLNFLKWSRVPREKVTESWKSHLADPTPKFVQRSMGKIYRW